MIFDEQVLNEYTGFEIKDFTCFGIYFFRITLINNKWYMFNKYYFFKGIKVKEIHTNSKRTNVFEAPISYEVYLNYLIGFFGPI